MNTTEKEKNRSQIFIYQGIAIAIITALSYIYAFRYEASYAKVFKIPSEMIELNFTIIVYVWIFLLTYIIFSLFLGDLILKIMPKDAGSTCFCYVLAGAAGRASALNKTEYLVINTSPEAVVLRIYGDKVICAPLDRKTKEIHNNLIIFKISNDTKISFSNENVGPLRMKE